MTAMPPPAPRAKAGSKPPTQGHPAPRTPATPTHLYASTQRLIAPICEVSMPIEPMVRWTTDRQQPTSLMHPYHSALKGGFFTCQRQTEPLQQQEPAPDVGDDQAEGYFSVSLDPFCDSKASMPVRCLAVRPGGVDVFDLVRLGYLQTLQITNRRICTARIPRGGPTGKSAILLALESGGWESKISLYSLHQERFIRDYGGHRGPVTCLEASSQEGYVFASASSSGQVRLWDVRKRLPAWERYTESRHPCLDIANDGTLAVSHNSDVVKMFDPRSQHKELRSLNLSFPQMLKQQPSSSWAEEVSPCREDIEKSGGDQQSENSLSCLRFSPDGKKIAATYCQGDLAVMDVASGSLLRLFRSFYAKQQPSPGSSDRDEPRCNPRMFHSEPAWGWGGQTLHWGQPNGELTTVKFRPGDEKLVIADTRKQSPTGTQNSPIRSVAVHPRLAMAVACGGPHLTIWRGRTPDTSKSVPKLII